MGTIKLILTLGLLALGVWVSAELIPPYFSNYEFQDTLDTEARLGTYSTKGDEIIRDEVFRKAQDLELPLTKDDIKVQRMGAVGSGSARGPGRASRGTSSRIIWVGSKLKPEACSRALEPGLTAMGNTEVANGPDVIWST